MIFLQGQFDLRQQASGSKEMSRYPLHFNLFLRMLVQLVVIMLVGCQGVHHSAARLQKGKVFRE